MKIIDLFKKRLAKKETLTQSISPEEQLLSIVNSNNLSPKDLHELSEMVLSKNRYEKALSANGALNNFIKEHVLTEEASVHAIHQLIPYYVIEKIVKNQAIQKQLGFVLVKNVPTSDNFDPKLLRRFVKYVADYAAENLKVASFSPASWDTKTIRTLCENFCNENNLLIVSAEDSAKMAETNESRIKTPIDQYAQYAEALKKNEVAAIFYDSALKQQLPSSDIFFTSLTYSGFSNLLRNKLVRRTFGIFIVPYPERLIIENEETIPYLAFFLNHVAQEMKASNPLKKAKSRTWSESHVSLLLDGFFKTEQGAALKEKNISTNKNWQPQFPTFFQPEIDRLIYLLSHTPDLQSIAKSLLKKDWPAPTTHAAWMMKKLLTMLCLTYASLKNWKENSFADANGSRFTRLRKIEAVLKDVLSDPRSPIEIKENARRLKKLAWEANLIMNKESSNKPQASPDEMAAALSVVIRFAEIVNSAFATANMEKPQFKIASSPA